MEHAEVVHRIGVSERGGLLVQTARRLAVVVMVEQAKVVHRVGVSERGSPLIPTARRLAIVLLQEHAEAIHPIGVSERGGTLEPATRGLCILLMKELPEVDYRFDVSKSSPFVPVTYDLRVFPHRALSVDRRHDPPRNNAIHRIVTGATRKLPSPSEIQSVVKSNTASPLAEHKIGRELRAIEGLPTPA